MVELPPLFGRSADRRIDVMITLQSGGGDLPEGLVPCLCNTPARWLFG